MPYVNVPNDLSKIKTKLAFNLTKRQLVCFGIAAAVGIPSYLLARSSIGNTAAMFLMMAVALPAFLLAMYEKDGLPFEKVVRNVLRARFLRPGVRPYQTENIYARSSIGNTAAMFLMMAVALPAFLLAMYEKDGLPFEKVVRNVLRARFLRPGVRPYQTENIYAPFTQRGAVRKEDAIAKSKQPKARPRKGR